MRPFLFACSLGACNAIYGIQGPLAESDARQFDGHPSVCPAIGTPFEFSTFAQVEIVQDCSDYTLSATGVATALCVEAGIAKVFQGPPKGPLAPASGPPSSDPATCFMVQSPRLSPDADQLFVATFDLSNIVEEHRVYTPDGSGGWTRQADLPVPQFGTVSAPSRGPDRRLLFNAGDKTITEWSDHGTGTWTAGQGFAIPAGNVRFTWLSSNGLRMIATINPDATPTSLALVYADRPSIDRAFDPAVPITGPTGYDPFVTDDCMDLYFSNTHAVFRASQL